MRIKLHAVLFVTLMTLFIQFGSWAADENTDDWIFSIAIGPQFTDVDGDLNSKFEEYRDVPNGAYLKSLHALWQPKGDWSFNLAAYQLFLEDERYDAELSKAGHFKINALWDQTPHFYSRNATWLLEGDPGNFTLSETVRSDLETNPLLMNEVLASTARPFDVRLRRDTAAADLVFKLAQGWNLSVNGARQNRQGNRRISIGTYERQQAVEPGTGPGTFDRERFVPKGLEMPEPVEYETGEYGFTTSFRRKSSFFSAGWHGSVFNNDVSTLFWDNPFEAPPSVSSSADRGRFARGGLDLPPDNTYNRFYAEGGFNFAKHSRLNAGIAIGSMKQDDSFLPFTQNEALFFPGPDRTLGTADDIPGTNPSLLPATNLQGDVRTISANMQFNSRPWERISVRAAYRFYDYNDESSELVFPGYAAFGESAFRNSIGLTLNGVPALFNENTDYQRWVASIGGAYRIGEKATADLEYRFTSWDYSRRQVEGTNENTFQADLRLTPSERVEANLTYLLGSRDFDGTYAIGLETSRVRAYDIWDRDRRRFGAEISFLPREDWSIGFAYTNWKDEYPATIPVPSPVPSSNPFPSFPYGLNESNSQSVSVSVAYSQQKWNAAITVGYDTSEWISLATSKTTLLSDSVQFDPRNRWVRNQDDTVTWISLNFETELKPEKLNFSADLTYSDYDGDMITTNVETPNINSAVAYDFPELSSDLVTAKAALRWTVTSNLDFIGSYWYEPYRLDDFAWDVLQPYMQGVVQETAGSPNTFRDANVSRYLFLDSRYSDYTANVVSLIMRLRF